jgi:tyrosinase
MIRRKNQATLSERERRRFVNAVLEVKRTGAYDKFVAIHRRAMDMSSHAAMMRMAHQNPWFLPWHREYLRRFEAALREADSHVALPYWDWTRNPGRRASLWRRDFMGGDGRRSDGHVTTGKFPYPGWKLRRRAGQSDRALQRGLGRDPGARLPTRHRVRRALRKTPYDVAPWDEMGHSGQPHPGDGFRVALEHGVHDGVHMWVGGTMTLAISPDDPVFFLHHCNVDRLWAEWQELHPAEEPYLPSSGTGTIYDADKQMPPFRKTPASVVDHQALGYKYV